MILRVWEVVAGVSSSPALKTPEPHSASTVWGIIGKRLGRTCGLYVSMTPAQDPKQTKITKILAFPLKNEFRPESPFPKVPQSSCIFWEGRGIFLKHLNFFVAVYKDANHTNPAFPQIIGSQDSCDHARPNERAQTTIQSSGTETFARPNRP